MSKVLASPGTPTSKECPLQNSVVNSNLNTINKPVQASLVIVVQMLVLGIPAIYLGKMLGDIPGIFIGLAVTYSLGGVISIFLNNKVMAGLKVDGQ